MTIASAAAMGKPSEIDDNTNRSERNILLNNTLWSTDLCIEMVLPKL